MASRIEGREEGRSPVNRLVLVATGVLLVLYPLVVYWGLGHFGPRYLAGLLAVLLIPRLWSLRTQRAQLRLFLPVVVVVGSSYLLTAALNDERFLLYVPSLLSLLYGGFFALTLFNPPSIIERLARMQFAALPPAAARHCTQTTAVWCGFFVVNAGVAFTLATWASQGSWALYTGLISYVLMGLLFAGEFVVRHTRRSEFRRSLDESLRAKVESNTDFRGLSVLLSKGRPGSTVIAQSEDGCETWQDFVSSVRGLTGELSSRSERRWCLCCEDSYRFAIGFFAILHAGRQLVLPGNEQSASLLGLKDSVDGVIADGDIEIPGLVRLNPQEFRPALSSEDTAFQPLDTSRPQIEIFTSGSSGERKSVVKTLGQLESETVSLECLWGERLGSGVVFSTVSHRHIHGLLLRLLWPLSAKRAFWHQQLPPSDLAHRMADSAPSILVSCPAHLRRVPDLVDLGRLGEHCVGVFSSGGPLAPATADRFLEEYGEAPLEIFGSTETGGVAWRQRRPGAEAERWNPLDEVEVSTTAQGKLKVRSPFATVNPIHWYEMADRVELLEDGGFVLEGQTDRVVEIEEERPSRRDMKQRIAARGCSGETSS